MIGKRFDEITKEDIDWLIESAAPESKTLDYKRELPNGTKDAKKDFLADVSALANASGGDIVFGISEELDENGKKTGKPERVQTIRGEAADEVIRRLDSIVRDGLEPRLTVQTKAISGWEGDEDGFVLVMRIPKSLAAPHMITFTNWTKFYSRSSARNFQLDVAEIRSAFLATESQGQRIRAFRQERLAQIVADETPVRPLATPQRLVLHVIPVRPFLEFQQLDLANYSHQDFYQYFPSALGGLDHSRLNIDGKLGWKTAWQNQTVASYCQLYFSGVVETVAAGIVQDRKGQFVEPGRGSLMGLPIERGIIKALHSYFLAYQSFGIESPIVVSVAILNCRGARLWVGEFTGISDYPIDRDAILLPDMMIENLDCDVARDIRPMLDALWNACGYRGSPHYDEHGNRREQR